MKNKSEYPKFISNQPCGKDMYVGKSQERLAKTLAQHIIKGENNNKEQENGNSIPHIIGLEGSWGSGKSNMIGILKMKYLKDTHFIYEYDAWGHQEDLQRRSFLESLTNELIDNHILPRKTKVVIDDKQNEITWFQKLEDLLARKRKTVV